MLTSPSTRLSFYKGETNRISDGIHSERGRAYPTWYATRASAVISRVITMTLRQNNTLIDFVDNGRAI